jgi:hypothetical protein
MVPDGDRRHHTESGRVIDQPQSSWISDHDIVAEFILGKHVGERQRRTVSREPIEGVFDGPMSAHRLSEVDKV